MTTTEPRTDRAQARRLPHGVAFWAAAAVFLAAMAFTTVPTPLYALYAAQDGFATWTTTVIFAAYAIGVVASLFLIGHLSDRVGRRPMILVAIALELAAAVLFLTWQSVPGLIVARIVTGLGVGALTAAATAHLGELRTAAKPGHSGALSGAVIVLANIGGLGVGPLLGGIIAEWAPLPLITTYVVAFAVLVVAAVVVLLLLPETAPRQQGQEPYRPQRVSVPPAGRPLFIAAGAGVFTAFAIFGLYTSLTPTFLVHEFAAPSRFAAGVVPFAVFASAAVAQVVLARVAERSRLRLAIAAMVGGLALLAISATWAVLWLFVLSGVVAGAGVGLLFRASMDVAAKLSDPARRSETLAAMFLIAYLGLTAPVVAVGVVLAFVPAVPTLVVFAVLVGIAVLAAGRRMVQHAAPAVAVGAR